MTTNPVYPTILVQVKIGASWVDLTNDVIGPITVQYGIGGTSRLDRVASTGTATLTLNNSAYCSGGYFNYYLPGSAHALTGWRKHLPLRIGITYANKTTIRFYGDITDLSPDAERKTIQVTVLDYMNYLSLHKLALKSIEFTDDISDVVASIVADLYTAPQAVEYNAGQDIFPTAFDTAKNSTTGLTEIQKVALSELGYVYVRHNGSLGETLVVEGRHTRSQLSMVSKIGSDPNWFLLMEDGSFLLQENGDKLILDVTEDAVFNSVATKIQAPYADNQTNQVTVRVYPRNYAATPVVLFTLGAGTLVGVGETKTITATYRDPMGASKISASSIVAPVANTDYTANSNSDGSGINMTPFITVSALDGGNGCTFTVQNNSLTLGAWITKLQIRGTAIYLYDPVEHTEEDATLFPTDGVLPLTLDMRYQSEASNAEVFSTVILNADKTARSIVKSATFLANYSDQLMHGFLDLDIGSLIQLIDPENDINNFYYIQTVDYVIKPGANIQYTWTLVEAVQLDEAFWLLGLSGYSELGTTTILGY